MYKDITKRKRVAGGCVGSTELAMTSINPYRNKREGPKEAQARAEMKRKIIS